MIQHMYGPSFVSFPPYIEDHFGYFEGLFLSVHHEYVTFLYMCGM